METVSHIKSKSLSPLEASSYIRAFTGTFDVVSGELSGLITNHGIKEGDFVTYEIDLGTPTVVETGVFAGSDLSAYAGGILGNIGYLRVLKTSSMFVDVSAANAAFPIGTTIYLGGVYTGEYVDTGEIITAPGNSVIDGSMGGGLNPDSFYIIIDLDTKSSGFPSFAPFTSETTISPVIDLYDSAGGTVPVENALVTAVDTNSITLSGSSDGTGISEISIRTDSSIIGKLNVDQINASSLLQNGVPVASSQTLVPYSNTLGFFTEAWLGKNYDGSPASNSTPKAAAVLLGADPFGFADSTNELIQILSHPEPNKSHIGLAIYRNVGGGTIHMRAFTFNYDVESDFQLGTEITITGADSTDLKASYVTTRLAGLSGHSYVNTRLFIFGGKDTPGTSVYRGIYTVNNDLTISTNSAWGDSGETVDNDFTGIIKVVDMRAVYSNSTRKRVLVLFNSTNIALFDEGSAKVWSGGSYDSSLVNVNNTYLGSNDNQIVVITNTTYTPISSDVPDASIDITSNAHATWDIVYSGSDRNSLNLYKLERFDGIGMDSIPMDQFGDTLLEAGQTSVFERVPTNFQNTSGRAQNLVFECGNNLLLFYKSYGYSVLVDKTTGKLMWVGKELGIDDTFEKEDFYRFAFLNSDIVLQWDPSENDWVYEKFYLDGPYFLASKVEGADYALSLPEAGIVTTDFELEVGKVYYASYIEALVTSRTIGTTYYFTPRRLGIALGANTFRAEMDNSPRILNKFGASWTVTGGALGAPFGDVGPADNVLPIDRKIVSPAYMERTFRYRRETPRWSVFQVPMADFQVTAPYSVTEGGYRIGSATDGYGGGIPLADCMIHQVVLWNTTNILGTGLSSALLSLGTQDGSLNFEEFTPGLEVYGVNVKEAYVVNSLITSQPTLEEVIIYLRTTGANIGDCTGTVAVAVLWSYYGHIIV